MPWAHELRTGVRGMGRPHVVVLSLLALLGILAMHSTPAMATASRSHSVTVVTSGVASPMTGMSDPATPPRHVTDMADMTETLESSMPSTSGMGHGDQTPAQHHMLQPCMSDMARTHPLALNHAEAGSALAAAHAEQPGPHSGNLTVLAPRREIPPPDLTKLCISRT